MFSKTTSSNLSETVNKQRKQVPTNLNVSGSHIVLKLFFNAH